MSTTDPTIRPQRWPLIARALFARGDKAGALLAWRKAAIESPHDATAWEAVSLLFANLGNAEAALLPARAAATLAPDWADGHARLGVVLGLARKSDRSAARAFRRALALAPDNAVIHRNAYPDLPFRHLSRAIMIDPARGASWLAVVRHFVADLAFDRADLNLRRGIAAAPAQAQLLAQLGELRRDQGELGISLRFYDRSLAVAPSAEIERALLLAVLYAPDISEDEHFARHLAYARRHVPDRPRPPAEPVAGRRIRLGYLSAGFYDHPTAALTVRLVEAHDRSRFDISLFAHVGRPDAISRRLQAASDAWIDVVGLPLEEMANRIRAAQIDILVHPAGRHDPIIWPVAALRPAPVQVALYEAATTGMAAFDYLVTDAVLNPRHGPERTVERLVRIPSLPLHELPVDAPDVTPLPALANGRITFGSLNSSAKLNDHVLALWAEVMRAVPQARLLIKAPVLASRRLSERVRGVFARAGIADERIELMSDYIDTRRDLLRVYERIDIGLDTFPYSGGMTTFEAMCQGVPVVTLAAGRMVGRWGATLAKHAGHGELVAETPAEFVEIARRLAGDVPALARLRARLRQDFLSSPLCDARLKARHLERAYRQMMRMA